MIRQFEDFGGTCFGFYTCLSHRLGFITESDFQKDIEAITTLDSNSLTTRSLQMSLALVAVKNFSPN